MLFMRAVAVWTLVVLRQKNSQLASIHLFRHYAIDLKVCNREKTYTLFSGLFDFDRQVSISIIAIPYIHSVRRLKPKTTICVNIV